MKYLLSFYYVSTLSHILGHRVGMFHIRWVLTSLEKVKLKGQLKIMVFY